MISRKLQADIHDILSHLMVDLLSAVIVLLLVYQAQRWKWVSGSWVIASDPLTHQDEITAQ